MSVIIHVIVAGRNLTGGGSGADIESDWGGVGLTHKGVALTHKGVALYTILGMGHSMGSVF